MKKLSYYVREGPYFLIYLILAILSLRDLIFSYGAIGHRWDWSIPYTPIHVYKIFEYSQYMWYPRGLGLSWSYNSNILFLNSLIGLMGKIGLNGEFISKGLILYTITLSSILMFKLSSDWLGTDKEISFISGLLYGFSPYLFNMLSGGGFYFLIIYPWLPLYLNLFIKYYRKENIYNKYLIYLPILGLIISHHRSSFLIIVVLVFIFPLFLNIKNLYIGFFKFLIVSSIQIVLFSYWLIPFIFNLKFISHGVTLGGERDVINGWIRTSSSLSEAIVSLGYFRDIYQTTIPNEIYPIWIIVAVSLVIIGTLSLIISNDRKTLYLFVVYILGIFFAKTGKPPFGFLNIWLFKNIFIFKVFRAPQTLLLMVSIIFPLFVTNGLKHIRARLPLKRFRAFFIFIIFISLVFISPFIISGDLNNTVSTFQTPQEYKEIDKILINDTTSTRICPIPVTHSVNFKETSYQESSNGTGADPWLSTSYQPPIFAPTSNNKYYQSKLAYSLYRGNINLTKYLLSKSNTKYILLRKDVMPVHGKRANIYNFTKIKKILNNDDDFKIEKQNKYLTLYSYKKFSPKIYTSNYIALTENIPRPKGDDISKIDFVKINDNLPNNLNNTPGINIIKHLFRTSKVNTKLSSIGGNIVRIENTEKRKFFYNYSLGKGGGTIIYKLKSDNKSDLLDGEIRLNFDRDPSTRGKPNIEILNKRRNGYKSIGTPMKKIYQNQTLKFSYKLNKTPSHIRLTFTDPFLKYNETTIDIDKLELYYLKQNSTTSRISSNHYGIRFTRYNPTKYQVNISNIDKPTVLIFGESFDSGWKMYSEHKNNGFNGKNILKYYRNYSAVETDTVEASFLLQDIKYLFKKPVDSDHFKVNGYANAWVIDSTTLAETDTITIYYLPQSHYKMGLLITIMALIVLFISLLLISIE